MQTSREYAKESMLQIAQIARHEAEHIDEVSLEQIKTLFEMLEGLASIAKKHMFADMFKSE